MSKFKTFLQSLIGTLLVNSLLVLSPVLAQSYPQAQNIASTSNLSENWAGYVANSGGYSGVNATWIVPAVSTVNASNLSADAMWVGIGGVSSTDLIQAGTQAIIQNGQITYKAWYETLPNAAVNIPLSIKAGDSIKVAITEISPNLWQITFTNNSTNQSYTQNVSYVSSHSSAEWIEERPVEYSSGRLIPLDNFGTLFVMNGAAIQNGSNVNIAKTGATALTMTTFSGILLASPSGLVNGDSFSISRSSNQTVMETVPTSTPTTIRVIRVTWRRGSDVTQREFIRTFFSQFGLRTRTH
ncbi:MAG TPA: G1 family glutamic endopeptidase [Candidatus Paceibacterota bacterium]|nr:G1 family glutamic endopeptidase [Candidatus Paceibacterota bacterium]